MRTFRNDRTEAQSALYIEKAEAKRARRARRNKDIFGVAFRPAETVAINPLTKYTVTELYTLAKNKGLKVTTKTRKGELLELLGAK